jgi:hypothetical protein
LLLLVRILPLEIHLVIRWTLSVVHVRILHLTVIVHVHRHVRVLSILHLHHWVVILLSSHVLLLKHLLLLLKHLLIFSVELLELFLLLLLNFIMIVIIKNPCFFLGFFEKLKELFSYLGRYLLPISRVRNWTTFIQGVA